MAPILNQEAHLSDYTYEGQSLSLFADKQIVQLVVEGHEDAFAELYHRYSRDIYNYMIRLVSNPTTAEDLLQDTFVSVWRGLYKFKRESSVKTWLFRIAHNKAMSWLRTIYRNQEMEKENSSTDEETPTLAAGSMLNWRAEMVQEAMEKLSANHRAVIELFYFMDLSYTEISEIMKCPLGTVKSRMSHALQNLNGILTNFGLES